MADSRTAITCPHHGACVCIITHCPKAELDKRTPENPPQWLDPWIKHNTFQVIVAITHTPIEDLPDRELHAAALAERRRMQPKKHWYNWLMRATHNG